MPITHLTSLGQLNGLLAQSKEKVTVSLVFHASWCGPCHAIAPTFEQLSSKYPNVNFLKCDVDACGDVSAKYKVSAMPTFIFLKGDAKVDQVRGADKSALSSAVAKYAASSPASGTQAFAGKGNTLGGSSKSSPSSSSNNSSTPAAAYPFANIDPQVKVFAGLVGAYLVFWYLS
ncbi:thioredoxin-like protein [Athelia psychrophila]|uniref:Thioredoxin-like protein n=1 Tax=Athelia psychrophila TaxID=1759441 RepID=A0A166NRJ4_9AGAM|nr:thioredoxin-like protein [Fibularhizoctonia sp. CBS 109695]